MFVPSEDSAAELLVPVPALSPLEMSAWPALASPLSLVPSAIVEPLEKG